MICDPCHSALGRRGSGALEHAAFSYLDRAALAIELSRSVSLLFPSDHSTLGFVAIFDRSTRVEMLWLILLARAFRAMYADVSSGATHGYLGSLHLHIILSSTLIRAI